MTGTERAIPVCETMMAEFDHALSLVPPKSQRKWLGIVTHFIGFRSLMATGFKQNGQIDIGAAYMGNYGIGERVLRAEADFFYCGHSHQRKIAKERNTDCINNGSHYGAGAKVFDVIETERVE